MIESWWNSLFKQNGYTIVTKKKCKWSTKAKNLLKRKKVPYVCIEISKNGNVTEDIWGYQTLKKRYNLKTFPLIFDENGKRIGGYTDLQKHFKSRVQ